MPKKIKSPKSTCDLCCDNIESDQDQLACEGGCGCTVQRYCAGVTTKHYAELTASSILFVCFYCSLNLFKTVVNQLQLQVDTLRGELDVTRVELDVTQPTQPTISLPVALPQMKIRLF